MKQIPLILLAALAGGTLVWFVTRRAGDAPPGDNHTRPASAPRTAGPVAAASTPGAKSTAPARSDADRTVEDLKGQVVVSLGTVQDIGRQAAVVMQAKQELNGLKSVKIADRTPEQRRRILELERQRAEVLGMLPEVAGFQNNPEEYAGFFSAMLQQAAGLDAAQAGAVHDYMRARGEAMIAAGLNEAREPADIPLQEQWEEKRDAFNVQTVAGVAAMLPPGEAERIGFNEKFMELLEQDFDKAE